MSPPGVSVSDIEVEAQRQKTALLFRNAGIAQAVNVVNGSLLAFVNTTLHTDPWLAFSWWALMVAVAAWRYGIARRFATAVPNAVDAVAWRHRYIAATAMTAALWGAGAVLFSWHAPDGVRLFTGLVLAGMVAGAVPVLAPVPAAFRIFALLVVLPLAAVLSLQADSVLHWAFAAMVVIFLAAVLASATYLHESLDSAIRLGLERGRMVDTLEHARAVAEAALAEQKGAERALLANEERSRQQLEKLVMQRTAELATAKVEAERANNAKTRFLAAVSHDLRQPLSALSLYVGALGSKPSAVDGLVVANMQNCVTSLSGMLSNLLDLSKLEAGIVTADPGDFMLDALIANVVSSQEPEANARGLQLRCTVSHLIARTDAILFRRIIENFVSNSIRYTEKGGVLIGCRRREGKMWVEVWDTGLGIPEDKTSEIFEEFRQLGNYERNRAKGSGLGLAIVAKTAELLGLQIRVRSRPGKGSMFAVEVPLGEAVKPAFRHAYSHRPLRIAVVEDNAEVALALTHALTSAGHEVIAAASRKELWPRLDGRAPDVVISDYRLAGSETGFDVITSLRTAFGNDLPALLITGDTDPSVIGRMAAERIRVQHKPLDFEALLSRIADLVDKNR
ncbi:HAMP domain-containing sensor histidine kinase [Azoarcus sp. KH32C]|uniref:ATP-binding response regulator n=1 Tax=Azoarcus sp. KH32C TaxID=748247 RepID=UPI0002386EA1|nr:HAMP domain-containing sensor histidine kinase [Azoarcus sp. KH32C]BAL23922.1 putative sensor kinase/response regulator hybrid protein [Azoarcus sp. KH32C]